MRIDGGGGRAGRRSRLRQAGLIERQVIGNQTHYRANTQSPVFVELAGLVRKTTGLADPLRESLRALEPAERAIDRRINPVMYTGEEFQRRRALCSVRWPRRIGHGSLG